MKSEPEDTGCFLIYLDFDTIINLLLFFNNIDRSPRLLGKIIQLLLHIKNIEVNNIIPPLKTGLCVVLHIGLNFES